MFARWAKTSKAFTKIGKEIAVAVKLGGPDPDGNPRLRMAMQTARTLNMPKDRVENAIQKASSKDFTDLAEIAYEGYAQSGVGIFVEAATDNPTRTVANIRNIFSKNGGNMGTSGSLEHVFKRQGIFKIKPPASEAELDELELNLIDHGLEEIFETDDGLLLYSSFGSFGDMQRELDRHKVEVISASLQRVPLSFISVKPEVEEEIMKLVEKLEEDDDVQAVFHNIAQS